MKANNKNAAPIMACIVCFALGAGAAYLYNRKAIDFAARYPEAIECESVLDGFKVPHPEPGENEKINNFLANYDKYTRYVADASDEEYIIGYVNSLPTASGMGFQIDVSEEGEFYFSEVEKNSEAEKQGIKEGDIILSAAGAEVTPDTLDALKNIGGKNGTELKMTVLRGGKNTDLTLKRVNAEKKMTAELENRMIGETLYIRLEQIKSGNSISVSDILNENKFSSVILDLRQNPGGDTGGAVAIADIFAKTGTVTEHAYDGTGETYELFDNGDECGAPLAVLTDSRTASAAEILTGLLKQNAGATLVGGNTFGKGIFQYKTRFREGTLIYTAGEFTVGDWPCWQGVGIAPDIEVEMDPSLIGTDEDVQLQKALELLG